MFHLTFDPQTHVINFNFNFNFGSMRARCNDYYAWGGRRPWQIIMLGHIIFGIIGSFGSCDQEHGSVEVTYSFSLPIVLKCQILKLQQVLDLCYSASNIAYPPYSDDSSVAAVSAFYEFA